MRRPIRAPGDADGRQRIALVMTADPIAIIVSGAWKTDHPPGAHVPVAAVDRVGEEAVLDVLAQRIEELLRIDAGQVDAATFQAVQHLILLLRRELGEALAARHAAAAPVAAVLIERLKGGAIGLRGCVGGLRALLLHALDEGAPLIEAFRAAVRSRKLAVEKDDAARLLASRSVRIRGDDPIGEGLDGWKLLGHEELPRPGLDPRRWRGRIGPPRQLPLDDAGARRGRADERESCSGQYIAPSDTTHDAPGIGGMILCQRHS